MTHSVKIARRVEYKRNKQFLLNFSFELCQLVNWLHPFFHSHAADRQ